MRCRAAIYPGDAMGLGLRGGVARCRGGGHCPELEGPEGYELQIFVRTLCSSSVSSVIWRNVELKLWRSEVERGSGSFFFWGGAADHAGLELSPSLLFRSTTLIYSGNICLIKLFI